MSSSFAAFRRSIGSEWLRNAHSVYAFSASLAHHAGAESKRRGVDLHFGQEEMPLLGSAATKVPVEARANIHAKHRSRIQR